MEKISWGIIGCGNVTEVKSGPAFKLVPNSELVAVMRRDGAKAEDYANRHRVNKWYSDARDLINDADVNAIYIATPPSSHESYALQALEAGKMVYVEKLMALNSSEAERMFQAAKRYTGKLSVAHYRRSQPRFLKIMEIIEGKNIGTINSVDLQFRQSYKPGTENAWRIDTAISGGGLFHDLAPHQLDLMLYFFGKPIEVSGTSSNKANLYDAVDYVSAAITFPNGIKFTGLWDFNSRDDEEIDFCEIQGSRGKIRFAVFTDFCELITDGKAENLVFEHLPHVQKPMIEQVVKYFLGTGPNPCSAEDGVEVMKMIDKITGNKN